ncbi:SAM-dependent methyltransferase [Conyzicola lurida]|uniref:SAM-dependent methyltransferase n=1 Tax=Conyzicola lurida TaxID=1172621 RepID=A0A841AJY2_9MICO|nr:class I SAM-dependent methyltransferase [Conyzicola lurida]MBB5841983.1 SAM-dependent methyltransferase [Conyzicola lurida]
MPIGSITRGTTGTNRLRRIDRWIATLPALRHAQDPLVVDLGYGASATTTLELHHRLSAVRPDVELIGIEIDPARVKLASLSAKPGVSFRLGGFEVPLPGDRRATVIRAFNVLRQYDESQVLENWHRVVDRLQPGGVLVEGTCNEVGRVASWVDVAADGPQSFTVSLRLDGLDKPSIVAERLPKVLIHRNVAGEKVHAFLLALDKHWQYNAALSTYAPSQRWIATVAGLRDEGWPVLGTKSRWRLGELTVKWDAVAPLGFSWGR